MSDHAHDRNCLDMFARLSEYIDNELDPEARTEIERHLEGCKPCLVCIQTLRRTMDICRRLDEEPVPEDFIRRLRECLISIPNRG
jgi:anti-sigma factor RsiW